MKTPEITNLSPVFDPLKQPEAFQDINLFARGTVATNQLSVKDQVQSIPLLSDYLIYRITDKTDIPYPLPILEINGDRVATPGALVTISGQPKSGKSALTGIVIAGAISKSGETDGLPGVEVLPNENGRAVIHVDTEQDLWTHQYNHKTILRRAKHDNCPDYFLSYNLRKLNIDEYQSKVSGICEAANSQFKGIHSIYIDGGADFIPDVNNVEQSSKIIHYFESLAIEYNTAVFVVVHTNPGSDKERGHFGSTCQRKSAGILSVKKEGDISYLDTKMMRFAGESPKIQFKYDKVKGYHVECNDIPDIQAQKAKTRLEEAKKVCVSIFGGQMSYPYGKSIDLIMKATKLAETSSKNIFKDMKAHEMIIQGEDNNWRINKTINTGIVV